MTTPQQPWAERGSTAEIEQGDLFQPLFDSQGLIPAIVTDAASRAILMFAWMDREALKLTLATGYAHFWSRSRRRIWLKGEESGNRLSVKAAFTDCDQDVLQLEVEVEGNGVACHTGARSCFYRALETRSGDDAPVRLRNLQGGD